MANLVQPAVGLLTEVHTTAKNVLGFECEGDDGGVYVYLAGSGTLGVGSWATYTHLGATAALAADAVGRVAIAMGAAIAGTFGWFCVISGNAGVVGACDTIAANKSVYIDGTAGRVDDQSVAGDLVFNAWSRSVDTANLATFQINRPSVQDGAYLV